MSSKIKSKAGFHLRKCRCGTWWSFEGADDRFQIITHFCPHCIGGLPKLAAR